MQLDNASLIVCGDFNSSPGSNDCVSGLLSTGTAAYETGGKIKTKTHVFGPLLDAYREIPFDGDGARAPPFARSTYVAARLEDKFVEPTTGAMTTALREALRLVHDRYAVSVSIEEWLITINGSSERGSEMRHARAMLAASGRAGLSLDEVCSLF